VLDRDKIFSEFPVLKTRRLILRALVSDDSNAVFQMRSNERINTFIARNPMNTIESANDLIKRTQNSWNNKEAIAWAGVVSDSGDIIGACGFNHIDFPNNRAEIGGEMSINYWGRKLAIEAVSKVVWFGFKEMGLHSIVAKVSPDNRGAIYLLEQLNFQKEAHFKDRIHFGEKYLDMAVYTCFDDK
jgi:ribosomal-protein-alanine N-acetyltransferase